MAASSGVGSLQGKLSRITAKDYVCSPPITRTAKRPNPFMNALSDDEGLPNGFAHTDIFSSSILNSNGESSDDRTWNPPEESVQSKFSY